MRLSAPAWFEDDLRPRFGEAVHPVPSFWRRIAVTRPEQFEERDLVFLPRTGETVLVLGVGARLDVRRGVGSQPAPIQKGDELLILGTAP